MYAVPLVEKEVFYYITPAHVLQILKFVLFATQGISAEEFNALIELKLIFGAEVFHCNHFVEGENTT